jgi:hypothetical protein
MKVLLDAVSVLLEVKNVLVEVAKVSKAAHGKCVGVDSGAQAADPQDR